MERRESGVAKARIAFSDDEDSDTSQPASATWECPRCTMVNSNAVLPCAMCYLLPPPTTNVQAATPAAKAAISFSLNSSLSRSSGSPAPADISDRDSVDHEAWPALEAEANNWQPESSGVEIEDELSAHPAPSAAPRLEHTVDQHGSTTLWDSKLPYFTPIHFLIAQAEQGDREVHVDYLSQFGGTGSAHNSTGVGASAAVRYMSMVPVNVSSYCVLQALAARQRSRQRARAKRERPAAKRGRKSGKGKRVTGASRRGGRKGRGGSNSGVTYNTAMPETTGYVPRA